MLKHAYTLSGNLVWVIIYTLKAMLFQLYGSVLELSLDKCFQTGISIGTCVSEVIIVKVWLVKSMKRWYLIFASSTQRLLSWIWSPDQFVLAYSLLVYSLSWHKANDIHRTPNNVQTQWIYTWKRCKVINSSSSLTCDCEEHPNNHE